MKLFIQYAHEMIRNILFLIAKCTKTAHKLSFSACFYFNVTNLLNKISDDEVIFDEMNIRCRI